MSRNLIQVVDNFYPDPDAIRRRALNTRFKSRSGDALGWCTRGYQVKRTKEYIQEAFRIRVDYWEDSLTNPETENGSFFHTFATGKRADLVGVHHDSPTSYYKKRDVWFLLIIYMTPRAPFDAGTSLWQHRLTGLTAGPTKHDAQQRKIPVDELERLLARDYSKLSKWREIDRVGNIYNRAVMFQSSKLHSASRHFGNNLANGRLIQVFYFSIQPSFRPCANQAR
jgi:Family of unknown function (DUF6445)